MPSTPTKQNTKRDATTPIVNKDDIKQPTKIANVTKTKKHKKYHFAPVNNFVPGGRTPENTVLKSISVSQIRNTAHHEISTSNNNKLQPPLNIKPGEVKLNTTPVKMHRPVKNLEKQREAEEFLPTQEVVWRYSPSKQPEKSVTSSSPEKCYRHSFTSSDRKEIESTPIAPSRLQSILNFKHIEVEEKKEYQQQSIKKDSHKDIVDSTNVKTTSNLLRDIDDILDDLGSLNTLNPSFPNMNEIPSSPTDRKFKKEANGTKDRLATDVSNKNLNDNTKNDTVSHKDILNISNKSKAQTTNSKTAIQKNNQNAQDLNNKDNFNNIVNFEDDEEDDDLDSLIEILTQKLPVEKLPISDTQSDNTNTTNNKHTDSGNNDFLLEYLDSSDDEVSNTNNQTSTSNNRNEDEMSPKPIDDESKRHMYMERAKCAVIKDGISRLVITNVHEVQVPKIGRQKILKSINSSGELTSVILRHPWVYLDVEDGDVIHIIEGINSKNKMLLSDDKDPQTQKPNDNLLVVNPDILLSATTIGTSLDCFRRAVIQSQFQDYRGVPSKVMLIGNIVHELLQEALKHKLNYLTLESTFLETTLDSILESNRFGIITCNSSVEELKAQILEEQVENIKDFVNKFVKSKPNTASVCTSGSRKKTFMSISNIIDIEENIWSPNYGLKGYLDATLEVKINGQYFLTPLEIKTGKSKQNSHEAQGLTYTFLLNDRYELPVDFFLLLYTRYNDISKYDKILHSVRHVFMLRNQMANKLKYQLNEIKDMSVNDMELPPILRGSVCDNCFVKQECITLHKLSKTEIYDNNDFRDGEYDTLTGHLLENEIKYREFFKKYYDLLRKEESSMLWMNSSLFLIDSQRKEAEFGNCLSNLSISKCTKDDDQDGRYLYEFTKMNTEHSDHLFSNFSKNEPVFISDEEGNFVICQGSVASVSDTLITISTKRSILYNKTKKNQGNAGLARSVLLPNNSSAALLDIQNLVKYRIDKNEIKYGLSMVRYNLLNLFLPPVSKSDIVIDELTGKERLLKASEGGDYNTRKFIVDGVEPRFRKNTEQPIIQYEQPKDSTFNNDQLKAIDMITRAEDYALVLGMPGTGKTTLIAEIIRHIVGNGKTVLLTSYTHSAVDNVLLKINTLESNIIRLGSKKRIHPGVHKYIPSYDNISNFEEYSNLINNASLVGTTCLGITDIMFSLKERDFDYVILDEASQVSLPVALGPLRYGSKFIMIGDHFQLPPLIINEAARKGGLDVSPFQILCEKHPANVIYLTYQYRMCEDIAKLSNSMMYDGQLKCGTDAVRTQTLNIPNSSSVHKFYKEKSHPWLDHVLKEQNRVLLLNYDRCEAISETVENNNIKNLGEAQLTYDCVRCLIETGVPVSEIGVMSLYRGQINCLQDILTREMSKGLEILTADQFQGRDKKCIIISLVRSNKEQNSGSLMKEMRRINVAMTRARSKLIIIGSKKMIKSVKQLEHFVEIIESNNWFYELPENCLDSYDFGLSVFSELEKKATRKLDTTNIKKDSKLLDSKPIIKQFLSEI
ncbi:hypothetical protein TPHA_0A05270 [Tetrapisispora phaffii CBS 4417]|uniref:DNA replication ATP-dependent helicase/nuclease n=1 Tax=Tetrapisispora phaffii (strain ATCC 24235 / CBS 4417 / NBRC 1672 / NRRL Y-8282 / UCD 70-5) TaxID=1071381 RepID=G8BNX3_TETPH|nr:hypothetical protein TPHA_0A05270 [Tetrapisispora phaffii CBS 4417]CCE61601.1 hypothetical protein TPHA_0A05270 [Tetrapisispora phaffii CBS 4417]